MGTSKLKAIAPAWRAFNKTAHIGPICDEAHYDEIVALMNALIDEIGNSKSHALDGLLYIVGELIRDYDSRHFPIPDIRGVDMIKFLMEQHGLTQSDMPEIGIQSVVSEILNGKRKLNIRQVAALAKRFNVAADVFIDPEQVAA